MENISIFLFKNFYKLFKNKIGSNELNSFEGAISLTILIYSFFILFFGNYIILQLFNYNFIKQTNEWILAFIYFIFNYIFYKMIKKQIKSNKVK